MLGRMEPGLQTPRIWRAQSQESQAAGPCEYDGSGLGELIPPGRGKGCHL
jgi:hypothetical protein